MKATQIIAAVFMLMPLTALSNGINPAVANDTLEAALSKMFIIVKPATDTSMLTPSQKMTEINDDAAALAKGMIVAKPVDQGIDYITYKVSVGSRTCFMRAVKSTSPSHTRKVLIDSVNCTS
ncbi:hypothetical protein C3D14_22475 [Salmonella enterica]|nr:hypothetical protein [Salmonella enterica]EBD6594455.1 hypothetical protein [Salmonella enterica]